MEGNVFFEYSLVDSGDGAQVLILVVSNAGNHGFRQVVSNVVSRDRSQRKTTMATTDSSHWKKSFFSITFSESNHVMYISSRHDHVSRSSAAPGAVRAWRGRGRSVFDWLSSVRKTYSTPKPLSSLFHASHDGWHENGKETVL